MALAADIFCAWCRAPIPPNAQKVNVLLERRQVGRHGNADTFPRYVLFPLLHYLIHLSSPPYAVYSHCVGVYACGNFRARNSVAGEPYVAPPPPPKEEEEAFTKEAKAAEAKWEGQA